MKISIINHILLTTILIGGMTGCGSSRKTQQSITVEPAVQAVMPDSSGQAHIDVSFRIPEHFFSKRSRLIISPKTTADERIIHYFSPIVVDAPIYDKKIERKKRLEGYSDPHAGKTLVQNPRQSFTVPFRETISVEPDITTLRIIASVSTLGCGDGRQGDTIECAQIYNPLTLLPDPLTQLQLHELEPTFEIRPKIRSDRGEARMQFAINKFDIDMKLGHNQAEMERMLKALQAIISDTLCTLSAVNIVGVASADGSLPYNTLLAEKRAGAAVDWLQSHLEGLTSSQRKIFSVGSHPEGWEPVLQAMTEAGDADSSAVRAILDQYAGENDDVQEHYIRRLPCWNNIRTHYLQKDRKVEYQYDYTIKSFTSDSQLLAMYALRPDAFNEEELLRVSTLKTDSADKAEVYATTLTYFPHSVVAANNLAIYRIRAGKIDEAEQGLAPVNDTTPAIINTRACICFHKQEYQRAAELWRQIDQLPQARYNLGLLNIQMHQLEEAYELLRPFEDLNSVIVALALGKNEEAEEMLDQLDRNSPQVRQVREFMNRIQTNTKNNQTP